MPRIRSQRRPANLGVPALQSRNVYCQLRLSSIFIFHARKKYLQIFLSNILLQVYDAFKHGCVVRKTICACCVGDGFISIAQLAFCSFNWVNNFFNLKSICLNAKILFLRVPIALDMVLRKRELLDFCKYALVSLVVVLVKEIKLYGLMNAN